ncbi:TonB-dependent receptor [Flavobacterium psychroterrae]|uniref:TonB-dependent receptor n=1 Tax=Flavobacterium psychroterrae TaxID=2133767 RepID=A0ABS5PHJ9_9FLAO|nr:outer membrane beta-barrel family protein [Flavobacterium psychroterrae]MBS7233715.1 TonB-dependent receptor [Flavobacterium psychroterrae]
MKIRIKFKSCFSILLFLCFLVKAQAQANFKGVLSGKVLDEKSEPLPFANVTILDENKKIILGGISGENGEFKIENVPLKKLIIEVSYTNYNTFSKQIILDESNKKFNLGIVKLEVNTTVLAEVVVVGEKSSVSFKRDKKVFNVGKDILAQSNSALDILENIPSVSVDVSGQVSLRGNANVTILINGRQSGLTLNNALDQIPAINIESIEVITNPSASYQSTGSAGILNIILKKNKKEGINGQVSLRYGVPIDSRIGGSINYKAEKLNFFATVGNRYTDYLGRYTSSQASTTNANTNLNQVEKENRHDDGQLFYGGLDYSFNSKETFTLAYNINHTNDSDKSVINYDYFINNKLDNGLLRTGKSKENRSYNQVEMNYLRTFDKKDRKFTIDFQYDFWDSTKDWNILTEQVYPTIATSQQLRTNSKNGNKDFVLQTDYITPIKLKGKFETGLKGEHRTVNNKYLAETFETDQWLVYQGLDNDVDYKETIGAGYAQYGSEMGKFTYLLGLRDEYTSVKISDVNKVFTKDINYNGLFPTAHFGYNFSEKLGTQLSYSRRINRPSILDLNPFNEIKDFTYQYIGNPDLNPSYTDAYELSGNKNFEKVSINASVYYHRTTDFFQDYIAKTGENSFTVQVVNLDLEDRYGFETSINYSPIKRLSLYSSFNYYKFSQEGFYEDQNFDFSNQFWQIQFRAQVKLPKDFNIQGFFDYQGENKNAQTVTASLHYLNITLNKSLLSNKMTIGLNASNVLDSRVQKQVTTNESYILNRNSNRNAQRFYLTILYRFAEKQFKERTIKESNRN